MFWKKSRQLNTNTVSSRTNEELHAEIELLRRRVVNLEYAALLLNQEMIGQFETFVNLIRPRDLVEGSLIRVGNNGDGGYVISNSILKTDKLKRIISIGIGHEYSFEEFFLGNGFSVLGIDGSVENPLPKENAFIFHRNFIGAEFRKQSKSNLGSSFLSFEDVIRKSEWDFEVELVKVDAEGHEYEILENNLANISKSTQIVIEFHGLELMLDANFMNKLIRILANLSTTHYPIHLHGNNAGRSIRFANGDFPTIIEVTFLRKEMCKSDSNAMSLPGTIDFPNVAVRSDIDLSPFISTQVSSSNVLKTICDWL